MRTMHTNRLKRLGLTVAGFGLLGAVATVAMPADAQNRTYQGERGSNGGIFGQRERMDRGATTRQPNRNLEARLQTDRTQYNGNRAVEITVSLTNVSQYDASINLPNRSLLYEVTIRDGRSNRIIYTLDSRRGSGNPRGIRLASGENRAWRELWDGRDSQGERVPSGTYLVEARIAGQSTISTQIYLGQGGGRPGDDDGWNDGENRPGRPGNGSGNSGGNPERPDWPGRPGQDGSNGDPTRDQIRSLRTTLTSNRTVVRAGDQVRLTYTIQNGSSREVRLRFTSGKQFDVRATNPDGRAVWQNSDDKFYTQALGSLTLRAGGEQTYTTTWIVPNNTPTGRYQLQAFLTPQATNGSGRVAAADLTLRVVSGNDNRTGYDESYRDERYGRNSGRNGDRNGGNRGNYGNGGYNDGTDYTNRRNRTPSGVIPGGSLGGPTVLYGSRSGALLVSPRLLTGPGNSQYLGKKVTVSGRCVATQTQITQGVSGWTLGGDGAILPVTGASPASGANSSVTVTGTLRQRPDGVVYLSVP